MHTTRLATTLTAINLVLMVFLVTQALGPARAQQAAPDAPLPILRGSGLEIVDAQGRVRALIAVHGPATVDGREYPETVLLRLTDPVSGPVVKLTAAKNGSALTLSDDADGGIQLYARGAGSVARVANRDGHEAILKP